VNIKSTNNETQSYFETKGYGKVENKWMGRIIGATLLLMD
jgi:hypothetical protein